MRQQHGIYETIYVPRVEGAVRDKLEPRVIGADSRNFCVDIPSQNCFEPRPSS